MLSLSDQHTYDFNWKFFPNMIDSVIKTWKKLAQKLFNMKTI